MPSYPAAPLADIDPVDSSGDYKIAGEFRPNLPPTIHTEEGTTFEIHAPEVTWQAPL